MKKQDNWKSQLRNSSIQPSDEAWLAVEAGLEKKSQFQLKKKFIISLVAASLIGFVVFISFPDFSTPSEVESNLVEENKLDKQDVIYPSEFTIQPVIIESQVSLKNEESKQKNNILAVEKSVHKTNFAIQKPIASAEKIGLINKNEDAFIQDKAHQLLAEVEAELDSTSNTNKKLRPAEEAEVLLAEAQLLIKNTTYNELYQFAKASDLLADVEHDISEQKLQNKVWQFVKNNVQNLESALASLK
ncbi:hypothetical protein [Psychroflexus salis]|mgnify:CR=1 FL=1|uniref:Uncharacterized protein n=1 Tax=Psychroflexus salis TaxID=1526574 RepID=A0A916ZSN0_9FLAO|nr:hypothetical protein [Psychroflexus salis]GGE12366.1 hypothetical protein GCM10010831_12250 [Psychroflexus salis]